MTTITDHHIEIIRTLADLLGLPTWLNVSRNTGPFRAYRWLLTLHHHGIIADTCIIADDRIALPIAVAHWQTEALSHGLRIENPYGMQAVYWSDGATCGDLVYFTEGDTISRLMATAEALLDGVRCVPANSVDK